MITHKTKTASAIYPRTKENTWYGYRLGTEWFEWWRSKKTAIKHIPNKRGEILRATLIGDTMYINLHYLTLKDWK